MIDVSQSVEHDHPHALEFLRKDVLNILEFYRKKLSFQLMTVRELFDFVVSDLDAIQAIICEKYATDASSWTEQETLDFYLDKVIMLRSI